MKYSDSEPTCAFTQSRIKYRRTFVSTKSLAGYLLGYIIKTITGRHCTEHTFYHSTEILLTGQLERIATVGSYAKTCILPRSSLNNPVSGTMAKIPRSLSAALPLSSRSVSSCDLHRVLSPRESNEWSSFWNYPESLYITRLLTNCDLGF